MKTARFALSALASISFVALAGMSGCAYGGPVESEDGVESSADQTDTAEQNVINTGDEGFIDPPNLSIATLASGDGWRRIRFLGELPDGDTGVVENTDRTVIVIEGSSKIANAPVPSKIKQAMMAEAALKSASEQNDAIAVDEEAAQAYETQTYSPYGACNNDDHEYSKTVDGSKTKVFKKDGVAGALSGSITITTTLTASATASLSVRRTRKNLWPFGCRTVWVTYRGLELEGNATVKAALDAQATFEKKWEWSDEVAKIPLGTWAFSAGGFPVVVGFNVPITVGVDAAAKATLNAKGTATATGSFEVACTTSTCSANKRGSVGYAPEGTPTVAVTGRVKVNPWAQAAVRGFLYHEKAARAQVGLRADLAADLWGYFGNDCGDANNDGVKEQVEALTLDMQGKLSVTVDAAIADKSVYSNSWKIYEAPHRFWDLIGSSALDPIFYVQSSSGTSKTVVGKMRPCYPYSDKVYYDIVWNDGSQDMLFLESPQTQWSRTHGYATVPGGVTLHLKNDLTGRQLNRTVSRTFFKPIGGLIPQQLP